MIETKVELDVEHIIRSIDARGYCVVPDVIPNEKVDVAREALHDMLTNEITDEIRADKSQRVGRIAVKHPLFLGLMCHPLVLQLWRRYIGEDVICATWSSSSSGCVIPLQSMGGQMMVTTT